MLDTTQSVEFLIEKCDEYNKEIQRVQRRILQLEARVNVHEDNAELVVILVKGATLRKNTKNKFILTISQPLKSTRAVEEELIEEHLDPTVIIDSTQWPPIYNSTPKGHERKISYPSCKASFAMDNIPVQKFPSAVYEYRENSK
jgi:hypothetical protein